jgi:alkyldihydroxyacetonephosphate synthase
MVTKWGDRESTHVNFTPAFEKFFFTRLGMDPDTSMKQYPRSNFIDNVSPHPTLPEEFLKEINSMLKPNQIKTDPWIRIENSVGRSYLDLLQSRLGTFPSVVELVLFPDSHEQIQNILKTVNKYKIPLSVVAGRTSVTSGVQAPDNSIAINLTRLNKVLEINKDSFYVTAQTGIFGPELERILNHRGFTAGHFPQSFEYSCLGGWVVTRGAGQNSTLYGKIEDMLLGMKFVTGSGKTLVIPILPARATGPDWLQILAGSEGAFGILTEVTLRIWKVPQTTRYSGFFFRSFEEGMHAYRDLMQDGYKPAILRLSDPEETNINIIGASLMKEPPNQSLSERIMLRFLESLGYSQPNRCLGLMVFEGEKNLVRITQKKAIHYAKKYGGFHLRSGPAKSWMKTRFEHPFLRDHFVDYGILLETFETSTTWDRIIPLYKGLLRAVEDESVVRMTHGSHFYSNGANLYITLITPQEAGKEEEQYYRIRKKVLDTFTQFGGAISHHHGIGRAFSNWLPQNSGTEGLELLENLKQFFDPNLVMNPGVFGFNGSIE